MLTALSIRSFVLIDALDLECENGFTALTGETGAGKSIILDALGLVLGGQADRSQIRQGADSAQIIAEFSPPIGHPVWTLMANRGLDARANEALVFRRVVSQNRPARAFINDQSVSAATLELIGGCLVEIHGQHAASGLMRASTHRAVLDGFAKNEAAVQRCRAAWLELETAQEEHAQLEAQAAASSAEIEWLGHAVRDLTELAPTEGEAGALTERRSVLLNSEKLTASIEEATDALCEGNVEQGLCQAARAADRAVRVLEPAGGEVFQAATAAAAAIERTLIELQEASDAVVQLAMGARHDAGALETVEARLYALRAAARKYNCEADDLPEKLLAFEVALAATEAQSDTLDAARRKVLTAQQAWQDVANEMTATRRAACKALPPILHAELKPLHLGRVQFRVRLQPLGEEESGALGQERVIFEVETNPGACFGPLQSIASGGELARFSLAVQCALTHAGQRTLIFDEADQGVGGAVAAAIGERLSRLARNDQVFAITHSPQVAAYGARQWRVEKEEASCGTVISQVCQLAPEERLEELARMLSGSSVTDEARAAASKLLEAA